MAWYDPRTWGDDSQSAVDQRADLKDSAYKADAFASRGEENYAAMTAEAAKRRAYLERLASGQDSVSAEQLRQGLQQNLSAQRSMAAGAAPANAAMAARTAAMQSARLGSGLAGQQATAGLLERQAAEKALADMIMQQRQQDISVGLGSRQNGNQALGAIAPEKSDLEKYGGAIIGGASLLTGRGGKGK
jgi:hypothetical protein